MMITALESFLVVAGASADKGGLRGSRGIVRGKCVRGMRDKSRYGSCRQMGRLPWL